MQAIILFGNLLTLLLSMRMFCIPEVFLTPSAICVRTIMFTFMYSQLFVTVCIDTYRLMLAHELRMRCERF